MTGSITLTNNTLSSGHLRGCCQLPLAKSWYEACYLRLRVSHQLLSHYAQVEESPDELVNPVGYLP